MPAANQVMAAPQRANLPVDKYPPSILHQTPWRTAFFNFGKAKTQNYSYFNPGLVELPTGLHLIARRSQNWRNVRIGFNDMVACPLSEPDYQPSMVIPIITRHYFDKEHFEDPRAIYHNGALIISACNFLIVNDGKGWTGSHQALSFISNFNPKNAWQVERRVDPIYGNNGSRIGMDKGMEKNWLWFIHQGRLHLVYQAFPHTVVEFDVQFKVTAEHMTNQLMHWDWGVIRGGTPPVLTSDGTEYLTFFHSSLPTGNNYHRQYHMGAYTFEAQPPFNITRMTTRPILSGSPQDNWQPRKPLVVFPCGSRLKDGKWLVTMGVNDMTCAWTEIPHAELEPLLIPVNNAKPSWKKTLFNSRLKLPDVTLVCVDDVRPDLAQNAIDECCRHVQFGDVQFFNSKRGTRPIRSMEDYSEFLTKELLEHIKTSHVLICQWDGYIINPECWMPQFLDYDYIGAPWPWKNREIRVGNGGFSLRSRRLLNILGNNDRFKPPFFPEDDYICVRHRQVLENHFAVKFAPESVALRFSNENNMLNKSSFGFHSYLTVLPDAVRRPRIFHHSGDMGDIIYGMATMSAIGGGVLFLSPNIIEGHKTRQTMSRAVFDNIAPLLNVQHYVWKTQFTEQVVKSCDYDLNEFRKCDWQNKQSILDKHLSAFRMKWNPERAWLSVDFPVKSMPILVNRSKRYWNLDFQWKHLVEKNGNLMGFIGTPDEHANFIRQFGFIPYVETRNLLEAARMIYGSKVFIGNQSCCMAIALGLGKNVIQETWEGENIRLNDDDIAWDGKGWPNCIIPRKNAIYCAGKQNVNIPSSWLK